MWQSNSRKRALSGLIHCTELRPTRSFHLKRVSCRIVPLSLESGEPEAPPIEARILLNDLTDVGTAIFTAEMLTLGSLVQIEIPHPEPIALKARVGWCQFLTSGGKVLAAENPSCRIGLVFQHETPEDQERIKAFCNKLREIYPGIDLTRAPYAA